MTRPAQKILILKTGFTETFSTDIQSFQIVSLGDILRSTPILRAFDAEDEIIWVTSKEGRPLLKEISQISKLMDYETYLEKKDELDLDLFLNLERSIPQSHFPKAKVSYGFNSGERESLITANGTYELKSYKEIYHQKDQYLWQYLLFGLLGLNYQGEQYCFSMTESQFKKSSQPVIGLNWQVGSKWPTKKIDLQYWQTLAALLTEQGYEVSWQQGHDHLETYINWIASCDFILTCDSLGLHIALAMQKKFIAFFGPTPSNEIDFYQSGIFIPFNIPETYACLPCHQNICHQQKICSDYLDYPEILSVINNEFSHD